MTDLLAHRIACRLDRNLDLPTPVLAAADLLGLTPEAIDVLSALAMPSIDSALAERLPSRPTIAHLIAALACDGDDERALREALSPSAPLVALQLVTLVGGSATPHEMREIRIDDRIVGLLRGESAIDKRLAGIATLCDLPRPCDQIATQRIARALETRGPIVVEGPARVGKVAAAVSAIVATRAALVCDVQALLMAGDPVELLGVVRRELHISDARAVLRVPAWSGLDAPIRCALVELVETGAILAIRDGAEAVRELRGPRRIGVPMPSVAQQAAMWGAAIGPLDGLEAVCARYPLAPGDIVNAAAELRAGAELAARAPTLDDVVAAARVQLQHRLGDVAELVSTRLSWSDVVLRADVADKVRELIDAARLRDRVMVDWGFEAKLPYGRSISALLSGAPGTGKTMVATVLGKELGLEVFRVDLSKVTSKYIGETEKNLARVFDEASRCRAILLFDEADSLFAKRVEVKSSNDRFANLEVNFLLQRLETHDGVVVLTTNAATAIDKAFLRRIRYRIEFPDPDAGERARLWRSMIPAEAPLAADVDVEELGRQFPITGGHIKNAVVRAAYRAMTDGLPAIDHATLYRSALAEWTELGNLTPPEQVSAPAVAPGPVIVRGSSPRLEAPRIVPMFPKPVVAVDDCTESTLIRLLHGAPRIGETIEIAYRRKEQEIRELFAGLPVPAARALHKRLTLLDPTDPLAAPFQRLSRERRERLIAFLGDARRRSAISA